MPGRQQEPSFQLPSGTTAERDGSYNLTTIGSIFYNTDTSNVEIRHEDPSNNTAWRDLVVNNREVIDISGNLKYSNIRFFAYNTNQSHLVFYNGDDISFNATTINTNSCFDTATNSFEAPIAGAYRFSYNVSFTTTTTLQSTIYNNIVPQRTIDDGNNWFNIKTGHQRSDTHNTATSGGEITLSLRSYGFAGTTSFILELNGGDRIRLVNKYLNSVSSNTIQLWGGYMFFCGEIITAL